MNVVVVESPAKAKTIEKYLGADYKVLATYGHVCDLPSKDGSVRPDEDFAMSYVNDAKSEKHLKRSSDRGTCRSRNSCESGSAAVAARTRPRFLASPRGAGAPRSPPAPVRSYA